MQDNSSEYIIFYVLVCALVFALAGVIVYIVYRFQSKYFQHIKDVEKLDVYQESVSFNSKSEIQENLLTKISQEIHDNVGLSLTVAKLNLSSFVASSEPHIKLSNTYDLLTKSIDNLRKLSHSLNSEHIINTGLVESMKYEINTIEAAEIFQINFCVEGDIVFFEEKKELVLFRIFQEALQNVIKHSRAKNVCVSINFYSDHLLMKIQDDGIGFDLQNQVLHSGHLNMRSRIEFINGKFHVETRPCKGTCITIYLPL
jgi:two-component system, NarL family, sensor kinase